MVVDLPPKNTNGGPLIRGVGKETRAHKMTGNRAYTRVKFLFFFETNDCALG